MGPKISTFSGVSPSTTAYLHAWDLRKVIELPVGVERDPHCASSVVATCKNSDPGARALNHRGALLASTDPELALRDWSMVIDDLADVSREELARALANRAPLHVGAGRLERCIDDATRVAKWLPRFPCVARVGTECARGRTFRGGDARRPGKAQAITGLQIAASTWLAPAGPNRCCVFCLRDRSSRR
jgi:hypothetical protein